MAFKYLWILQSIPIASITPKTFEAHVLPYFRLLVFTLSSPSLRIHLQNVSFHPQYSRCVHFFPMKMKLNAIVTINLCIRLSSRAPNLFLFPFWSKASFLQVSHQPGIIRMGQWCHPTGSENLFMPFQPSGTHPDVFQLSASVNEAVTMWKYAWVSCYDAFIWRQFGSSCLQLATWSLSVLFQTFRKLCLWIPTFPVIWFPHLILEVKGGMNIIHIINIHFNAHSISNINHMGKFQVLFLDGCLTSEV